MSPSTESHFPRKFDPAHLTLHYGARKGTRTFLDLLEGVDVACRDGRRENHTLNRANQLTIGNNVFFMARRMDEVLVAKNAAANSPPIEFVHRWLLSSRPFAFRAVEGSYPAFKAELSARLHVHAAEMTIVGSAQLGFSLNPSQLLRRFRRESDIDVVVVSSAVFDEAWHDLMKVLFALDQLDSTERQKFKKTRENFFNGYLRPDLLPSSAWLSKEWFPKLAGPYSSKIAARYPVKAWLFKSWWHVEHFYSDGISRVQPELGKLLVQGKGKRNVNKR